MKTISGGGFVVLLLMLLLLVVVWAVTVMDTAESRKVVKNRIIFRF
jgi:hypothetical protein